MNTTNFSLAIDQIIRLLGTSVLRRAMIYYVADTGIYYVFEKDCQAEIEFTMGHVGIQPILNLDAYQMKVFIQRIKSIQMEIFKDGDYKESNAAGGVRGGVDTGMDVRTAGFDTGGRSDSKLLSGTNDNNREMHTGEEGGDSEVAPDAEGGE